jgi:hypothetical protein
MTFPLIIPQMLVTIQEESDFIYAKDYATERAWAEALRYAAGFRKVRAVADPNGKAYTAERLIPKAAIRDAMDAAILEQSAIQGCVCQIVEAILRAQQTK